ncbi:glycoside hydrolase family protein [Microbulbifer sp. JMSA002]|uniref:glycoside hydrolase family protein n=1 Tax=Microbulbifer sp. JMSA002 TaxID=3243368 RepID=UPI004039E7D5
MMNHRELIKLGEGKSLKLYKCTGDKWTIGFGWNIEDNGIPEETAEQLLDVGIERAEKDLFHIFGWIFISDLKENQYGRYCALLDMAYNLGFGRFKGFKKMIAAAKAHDWEEAAEQAKDSRWYHQVRDRSERDVHLLRTGRFPA